MGPQELMAVMSARFTSAYSVANRSAEEEYTGLPPASAMAKIRLADARSGAKVLSTYTGLPDASGMRHRSTCISQLSGDRTMMPSLFSTTSSIVGQRVRPYRQHHWAEVTPVRGLAIRP